MNEESLLKLLRGSLPVRHSSIIVGSGDDCAIVQPPKTGVVLKTDAVVEGIHFERGTPLETVGWKALCRPISDFAAMGAIPQHALITVAAPASWKKKEWLELTHGINKAATQFEITIVGGEITRSPGPLFLSVMLTGFEGSRSLLRSGAKPGDLLCVTGKLGGSFKSGRHLTFMPRLAEGQWLAQQTGVHAMMDLSDGLGSDLPRLAAASSCSFFINEKKLPRHPGCTIEKAISDGEDYELIFSLESKGWKQLSLNWKKKFPHLLLTRIGHMLDKKESATPLARGFDHYIVD
ncbi:MAG: thiamine-phosphate kinase [Chthoniobacterales bacterium]|nr:thiamine-phosphate kinase [Chthoniobacterales bacterium]